MKYILTTFLIIFTTAILFGQSKDDEPYRSIDEIKLVSELEQSQQKLKLTLQHKEFQEAGIVQTHWIWKKHKGNNTVYVMTLSHGEAIFYREFYYRYRSKDYKQWNYEKLHTSEDNFLMDKINKILGSEINLNYLSRLPERSVVGENCSISPTMADDEKQMLELVKNGDVVELERWLQSINPVKQVYAYWGLKLLQSDSIHITDQSTKRMMVLEKSTTAVYSCSGCTMREFITVEDHLSTENVAKFIKRWKRIK